LSKQTPQVEDGFVRIASELYDAILLADFSKRELLVLMAIIRKTYGFNKKTDDLTNTMLAAMTGLDRANVSRAIDSLQERGVITVASGHFGKVLGVQKNYRTWAAETPAKYDAKTARNDAKLAHAETASPCQNDTPSEDAKTASTPCQIGTRMMPKRHPDDAKTAHTIDNPNRQPQKTTPIGSVVAIAPTVQPPVSAATWDAYSTAYERRYGIQPVRNAQVNAQLANLVKRIGGDDAPHVAAWYVGHNASWYVTKGHTVAALLADAEKLRTEWATNRRITNTSAKQADRTQANGDVWQKLIREREEANGQF